MPGRMMPASQSSTVPATHPASIALEPPGGSWLSRIRAVPTHDTARATRDALGLSTDTPIVMGGHQPGLWHPGILAKLLAIRACCERAGAAAAWVVVDQSPGAGARVDYPATPGGTDKPDAPDITRETLLLGTADAPPAAQRTTRPLAPRNGATSQVREGLATLARLLTAHADASSLAAQLHAACTDALVELGLLEREVTPVSFFASDLHTTPVFTKLLDAMRADAIACARLYNEAANNFPDAGVRALAIDGEVVELPLWERTSTPDRPGPWRTVTSDRLADLPNESIVLRGLPMTGLLRQHACDLFVHGTGGGASGDTEETRHAGYDRVTEQWFADWLGVRDLAPSVVATATLRLDFHELPGVRNTPTPRQIADARALAHRAAHDPTLLGDAERGRRKRELAAEIAALPRNSRERYTLYRRMHDLRDEAVEAHAETLKQLHTEAEALATRQHQASIIDDRTWSFLFHTPDALASLRREIDTAFAGADR